MTPPTEDHDLLVKIAERQEQMNGRVELALVQLQRGNERFEQIALKDQAQDSALIQLRDDLTATTRTATEAASLANVALRTANKLEVVIGGPDGLRGDVMQLKAAAAVQATRSALLKAIFSPAGALVLAILSAALGALLTHYLVP